MDPLKIQISNLLQSPVKRKVILPPIKSWNAYSLSAGRFQVLGSSWENIKKGRREMKKIKYVKPMIVGTASVHPC
jgi:hypothetical protein